MKRICAEKYCRRDARAGKRICTTCDKKIWRKKYPMKAAFQTLRHNATRRGKEFKLTFDEFVKFCYETNYMAGKGRSKKSFSIDRIDNLSGYNIKNIRMITKSANSRKHTKILSYDWRSGYARVI